MKANKTSGIAVLCLIGALLACAPWAAAQGTTEFTLQASSFNPDAIGPGGTSSSILQIGSVNGFSGTVALSCQVTSQQATVGTPVCMVSPASVTAPASATATITTVSTTTTVGYSVTITGTGPTTTYTTTPLQLTVLAVTPQFTITVLNTVAPTSVPAGSGAEGVISVNPINGYISPSGGPSSGVTLSCASISPLVTIAPVCSFTYPTGRSSLNVNGTPATSTLTISTFGPITTGAVDRHHNVYAWWISLPMLGLVGFGAAAGGKRSRKAWTLLAIFVVSGTMLLVPACGTNTTSTTTPNGVTPANSYTFTIVGVDSNGVVSSNTGTTSTGPTVSLTVTAPPKTP
ncbi:MAG TPA: hypothetical protein VE377_18080 [Candidatus Dormibacteraeota bacterium]|nr:hypothetical protein [Candidatus Dormibacteraeota bacterium]